MGKCDDEENQKRGRRGGPRGASRLKAKQEKNAIKTFIVSLKRIGEEGVKNERYSTSKS